METVANSPLLPKLLDLSIALFVLVVLVIVLGLAIWKLYQQQVAERLAHAAVLAEANAKVLLSAQDTASNRKESSEQMRGLIEQTNNILRTLERDKTLDPATRKLLFAIAEKLGCSISEIL